MQTLTADYFVGKVPRLLSHGSDWREVEKAPGAIFLKVGHPEIVAQLPRKARLALRLKRPAIEFLS